MLVLDDRPQRGNGCVRQILPSIQKLDHRRLQRFESHGRIHAGDFLEQLRGIVHARASQQIRNAKFIKSCSSTQLVLRDATGTDVTLAYSPDEQSLLMTNGGNRTTILAKCTNFQFSIYQRTPTANSFELYTNAWSTNTAKVVQMQWVCSRKVTGDKGVINAQVSAQVVIRNQ